MGRGPQRLQTVRPVTRCWRKDTRGDRQREGSEARVCFRATRGPWEGQRRPPCLAPGLWDTADANSSGWAGSLVSVQSEFSNRNLFLYWLFV